MQADSRRGLQEQAKALQMLGTDPLPGAQAAAAQAQAGSHGHAQDSFAADMQAGLSSWALASGCGRPHGGCLPPALHD